MGGLMIGEEYIKIIESFKQNQIAARVKKVYVNIFEIINSKYTSLRITPYFKLKREYAVRIKKIIAEICNQNGIPAINFKRNPENFAKIKKLLIDRNIKHTFTDFALDAEKISNLKELILDICKVTPPGALSISPDIITKINQLVNEVNQNRVPFVDYEREPDNISQIKKFINAIHHALLAVEEIESLDARTHGLRRVVPSLCGAITDNAYEASRLATHFDVDLKEMFGSELAIILPLFGKLQTIVEQHSEETIVSIKKYPWGYKTGEITGITVKHLQPLGGDVDYNFLTKFSAELPSYLSKFTKIIEEYSSKIKKDQPSLNQEKLEKIQSAALELLNDLKKQEKLEKVQSASLELLNDLKKLEGNSLFISIKFLNYIHIIRNIITLSLSSLEQMGELSDKSQEFIRDTLTQFKYSIFPELFSLVDKIEINFMLRPGVLSVPLMHQAKALYQAILFLPKKMVDFKVTGQELLTLEDPHFMELRLKSAYKRIDDINKTGFETIIAYEALERFFNILKQEAYQSVALSQLPTDIKETLRDHYKRFKSFMIQLDVDFNNQMINSLLGIETWGDFLSKQFQKLKGALPPDHITLIIEKYAPLKALITKQNNSLGFRAHLNQDLINFVRTEAKLYLYPYHVVPNVYVIDESIPLQNPQEKDKLDFISVGENTELIDVNQLTASQAYDLHQWYENKHANILEARDACAKFTKLINNEDLLLDALAQSTQDDEAAHSTLDVQLISLLSAQDKSSDEILKLSRAYHIIKTNLLNQYIIFKPYFSEITPEPIDHYLNKLLSDTQPNTKKNHTFQGFFSLSTESKAKFINSCKAWKKRLTLCLTVAKKQVIKEYQDTPLQHESTYRSHYLIKHTNFSKGIRDFRVSLFKITSLFNKAMQEQLVPRFNDIRFPEMEKRDTQLAQGKQVRAIKDIYNSLYHLEKIACELEELNDSSYKIKYLKHLKNAYLHLNEIIEACKRLKADPHSEFIAHDIMSRAKSLYMSFLQHSDAYKVGHEDIIHEGKAVKYNPLWYVLNAFYISPKHIRSFKNTHNLTTEELQTLHLRAKKATIKIEAIIKSSDSYFKLFLQTPNMFHLYKELTRKLNEFTTTIHGSVLNSLDKFRDSALTPLLLEADQWEDKIGLSPGRLSEPLRKITNEFFKGFLHPQSLHSQQHISLICDTKPLEKRIAQITKQSSSIEKELSQEEKYYADFVTLYTKIQLHKGRATSIFITQDLIMPSLEKEIPILYKKILPKLTQLKLDKKITINPSVYAEDHRYDNLCNDQLKEYDPQFTEIEAWISASYHYVLGLRATHKIELQTCKEKLDFLLALKEIQTQEKIQFTEEYTTEAFHNQLDFFCGRPIGLEHIDKEYAKELRKNLLEFEASIINQSKIAPDINLSIKNLLQAKISIFEKDHYQEYYQLDLVMDAVARFKNYFTQSIDEKYSIENAETLGVKSTEINKILDLAINENETIKNRLAEIKKKVNDPNFTRIILTHRSVSTLSFLYLKMCFLYLLEVLHLYTPPRKTLLNNMKKAANNPPNTNTLIKKFGLFAQPTPNQLPKQNPALEPIAILTT